MEFENDLLKELINNNYQSENQFDILEEIEYKKFVCFGLNSQEYAIKVEKVLEVISEFDITEIIHTPAFILGVINLRGNIIPVIDIKIFFELEKKKNNIKKLVIIKLDDKICALAIDTINEIKKIRQEDINPLPVTLSGKIAEFLNGVFNYNSIPIMILNIDNIMNSEEFKQFE